MSDPPITPRSNATVPDTTVPMATKPAPDPGAQPNTAPMNARATQMSASVGPTTLESPHDAPPRIELPPQSAAAPFVSEEISGVLIAQEAQQQAPSRRLGASTLESRLVPPSAIAGDGTSAPLPPLPPVIDVGAPAHAFVARSAHAPPPMPQAGPGGRMMMPAHAHHGGQAHAARAPTSSTSTSTMALVVVGVVIGLLGIAAVVVAVGFFATRRTAATSAQPAGKPPAAAATQAPRPVRK